MLNHGVTAVAVLFSVILRFGVWSCFIVWEWVFCARVDLCLVLVFCVSRLFVLLGCSGCSVSVCRSLCAGGVIGGKAEDAGWLLPF